MLKLVVYKGVSTIHEPGPNFVECHQKQESGLVKSLVFLTHSIIPTHFISIPALVPNRSQSSPV